ncbi:MAG: segregation and condensation protein A [Acidimicrobiia bacterium]
MPYEVSTGTFEGPFELLLHLILKQEVDLWDVSLSTIVDGYLEELERMETLDLEVATEFLLIAATLVELKARRLLPGLNEVELDEELLRFEERDLLLARLLECKTFKDAARALDARIRAADQSLPRTAGPEEPFRSLAPDPLEAVAPSSLLAAAMRALAPKSVPRVDTDHVAPIRASVRDAVDAVLAALPESAPTTFRQLVAAENERLEVIVRFLALLELYKQGLIELDQVATFGDLIVRRRHDAEALDTTDFDEWGDAPTSSAESEVSG